MRLKTNHVESCDWYHRTSEWAAKSILDDGFIVEIGGNQKLTEGIYLSNHTESQYGPALLRVCVKGNFIDLSEDKYNKKWTSLKKSIDYKNYTELTDKIQKRYPKADGILFDSVLVVWWPSAVKKVELLDL